MTIVELIKRDHDEVIDLFEHLTVLARDGRRADEAARVAARLVANARIHSRAEERVLYEVMQTASAPLKAFALAGPHQHVSVDTTLDKLLERRPGDDEYRVLVKVARDLFDMHARDEEEGEVLPLLAGALTEDELQMLATDMLAEKARIRPHVLRFVGMPAHAA